MLLFIVFILWIAALSVCIVYAYDEHSTKAFIALALLALVLIIIIIFMAIFTPDLIGV